MKNVIIVLFLFFSSFIFSQTPQDCLLISSINENAIVVQNPGETPAFEITWNNFILHTICANFNTRIEFYMDNLTNPNDGSSFIPDEECSFGDIDESHSIDFFNETSFNILVNGFTSGSSGTSKCVWWRIVIDGTGCGSRFSSCSSSTPWHYINS